ncbi:MAG: hypothetical protein F4128_00090 [Gammaproteobacteria bacterium]|nr:hypothetical protein [Gammaproteobacteria bacterium]
MAKHTIDIPDIMVGEELRRIVWDDEARAVSGNHSRVPDIQAAIVAAPVDRGDGGRIWRLRDPGRDPAEFLVLLWLAYWPVLTRASLRAKLPAVFDGVELPEGEPAEELYIVDPTSGEAVLA